MPMPDAEKKVGGNVQMKERVRCEFVGPLCNSLFRPKPKAGQKVGQGGAREQHLKNNATLYTKQRNVEQGGVVTINWGQKSTDTDTCGKKNMGTWVLQDEDEDLP